MEKFLLFSVIFIYSINPIFPTRFENNPRYLYVHEDENQLNKPLVIKNTDSELTEFISQRYKRDITPSDRNENPKNITTKVNTQTKNSVFFYFLPPPPSLISTSIESEKLKKIFMRHFN
jgi:hypothetical protein